MIRLSRDSNWQVDKYFIMYVKVYVKLQKKKKEDTISLNTLRKELFLIYRTNRDVRVRMIHRYLLFVPC